MRTFDVLTVIFVLLVAVVLFVRVSHPDRWSRWGFGDAQTLMAKQHYVHEGFWALKFLWVPQGYSNVSRLLDDPNLNHHAHGSIGELSGLGPKRIYTHWPSWYAIPYGLFAKLGVTEKSTYQKFALMLSLVGGCFFIFICRKLGGPVFALLSAIFLFLAPDFLGYADSLATMPYDHFWRFVFLFVWVRMRSGRGSPWAPYLIYFGSTMTSLDSLFWIPLVAVGYDVFIERNYAFKQWTYFIVPLIFSLAIQFTQNGLYMGFGSAWQDWVGYFFGFSKSVQHSRLDAVWILLKRAFGVGEGGHWILLLQLVSLFGLAYLVEKRFIGYLLTLFIAGAAFPLTLPAKIHMIYESLQFLPFVVFAYATLLYGSAKMFLQLARSFRLYRLAQIPVGFIVLISSAICLGSLYSYDSLKLRMMSGVPTISKPSQTLKAVFDPIKEFYPGDKVYFQLGELWRHWNRFKGVAQVHPHVEYYSGGLFLTANSIDRLVEDLNYLWQRKTESFVPIIFYKETHLTETLLLQRLQALAFEFEVNRFNSQNKLAVIALNPIHVQSGGRSRNPL